MNVQGNYLNEFPHPELQIRNSLNGMQKNNEDDLTPKNVLIENNRKREHHSFIWNNIL